MVSTSLFGIWTLQCWNHFSKTRMNRNHLVGGFNPFERCSSNWESSLYRGENKKCLKPPPREIFVSPNIYLGLPKLLDLWNLWNGGCFWTRQRVNLGDVLHVLLYGGTKTWKFPGGENYARHLWKPPQPSGFPHPTPMKKTQVFQGYLGARPGLGIFKVALFNIRGMFRN